VPRLTGRRTIRGVPAGFRRGGLSLFTAGVEVRITGGSGATKLRTAQLIGRTHLSAAERGTVTARLPEPILRPVSRLVPCATR